MSEHTHLIVHYCSDQKEGGVQGGTCADPKCELEKFREDVLLAFHEASQQKRPFFAGQRLRRLIRELLEKWEAAHR